MKKRICLFLLAAMLLSSLLPTAVFAEEEEPATYSMFDMEIPFENMVDCYRTTHTTIGMMQQVNYFDYVYSGLRSKQIHELVPDVVNNSRDYYFRFSKNANGTAVVLTMYRYSDPGYSYVLSDDGFFQTYGQGCFIYAAKDGYYGTFVSFRDKEYHMCGSEGNHRVNYPREDSNALDSSRRSCILCGCGETFIIEGTYPTIDQLEALPLSEDLLQVEHEHRYGSSGKCACGKLRYSTQVSTEQAGSFAGAEAEGLGGVLEDHFPGEDETVEIFLQIKDEVENESEKQAIAQAADGQQLNFFDLSLLKVYNGGTPEDIGAQNQRLLKVTLPYASWGKGHLAVYRYHDGAVEKLSTTPNADGEYFIATKQSVTLYTKKFSTYAIAYVEVEEFLKDTAYDYSVAPTYTVTIPETIRLDKTYTLSVNDVVLPTNQQVRVCISSTGEADNAFALTNAHGDKLSYSILVEESAVALNETLLTARPGKTPNASVELSFVSPGSAQYAGSYTGSITFAILVESAEGPR